MLRRLHPRPLRKAYFPLRLTFFFHPCFALLCVMPLIACGWLALAKPSVAQTNCIPRPNGMIAWYRGEGNGLDSVGTNHGTLVNGVNFTTGKVLQAFSFNGLSELVVPNVPALNPARLTIEAWVYPTQADGGVDIIVNKDFEPYGGYQYELGIRGTFDSHGVIPAGNFAFAMRGVNGLPDEYLRWVNGGAPVPLNTWTHLAVTYDGTTARTYLNGAPVRTLTGLSGDIAAGGGPLKIASRAEDVLSRSPNERFNGRIDEVSLYNRALSADEILAIFKADSAGKCPVQNTPPTITTTAALTRQQGNPGSAATIATVNDLETPANLLTVTATTLPAGLTISNLSNVDGTITATIAAACDAPVGSQTVALTVTDASGGSATTNLTINVTANTAPTLGPYPATTVSVGQSLTVAPSAAPADNNKVTNVSVVVSAGFGGAVTVNASTGLVSINNATPGGSYVVTVSATDNCGTTTTTPFNLTVGKLNSVTQLTVPPGPHFVGQAVPLTALVTATGAGTPTGNVTFRDGTATLGQGVLNAGGAATLETSTLLPGLHQLTAVYSGDSKYESSTSAPVTILIARPLANVSAASYQGNQFSREQIVAAFGTNLATRNQAATTVPLPTTLAGTTVSIKDSAGVEHNAQLFFVSANQVNYLMPVGVALGPATVTITNASNSDNVSLAIIQLATIAPGVFTANANGRGVAAAQVLRVFPNGSQRYEPVMRLDPATNRFVTLPIEFGPPSERIYLLLYCTGLRYRSSLNNVTAVVGTTSVTTMFAGAQGSLSGLDQINLQLTPSLSVVPNPTVLLTVDGVPSNSVQISFR